MQRVPLIKTSILAFAVLLALPVHAASGGIDSAYKYAWNNQGGYVNFAPSTSVVTVSDSSLSGSAWSQNDGWINLSPTNGGVTNSNGTLGGFAWDETAGWISFTGVTIDSQGKFHGQAVGANATITFDCSNCDVRTTWRASVSTPVQNGSSNSSGGGASGQHVQDTTSGTSGMANAVPQDTTSKPSSDGKGASISRTNPSQAQAASTTQAQDILPAYTSSTSAPVTHAPASTSPAVHIAHTIALPLIIGGVLLALILVIIVVVGRLL